MDDSKNGLQVLFETIMVGMLLLVALIDNSVIIWTVVSVSFAVVMLLQAYVLRCEYKNKQEDDGTAEDQESSKLSVLTLDPQGPEESE